MAILPSASVSIDDESGAGASGANYAYVLGCVGTSADSTPRVISSAKGFLDQYGYAIRGMHETIHLAARYGLSDRELAIAAEKITGIQTNFPSLDERNPLAWSRYWNDILKERCPPVRKQ